MQTEIITIGDELLIGQVIDTNSAWMAGELNRAGFDVRYKTTVGDNETDIIDAVSRALLRANIVLVTGGIGPTKDDITKKTLCRFFDTSLVFDESVLANIQDIFRGMNKNLNELTIQQAYVPETCTVIQNRMGTAPITWFERDGKILVSMPGVPYEMQWVMSYEILPRLQQRFPAVGAILHQSFWVKNYTESRLALLLEDFENRLPAFIKLAYLPTSGLIRLRLTGKHTDSDALRLAIDDQSARLTALLQGNIVAETDATLEQTLDVVFKSRGLTFCVAESCTGGKLASLFTAIAGCSQYFRGGVVSYSNEAKTEILQVNPADITYYGAVSQKVAEQMALGAQELFHADCAIAVTGIAGPDGGTPDKPVGTVWIAVAYGDHVRSRRFQFSKNRENNILRSCNNAMAMLLELLG
ncbi:MAG: CinA family nicotinamide mononucleotide deamidase-related protein [Candidatus Symbiothrix sp.]|nr:CinA family nicotinamide mononucleotide deamidase-related protein [Candidatus Symbiothrix sp.]